MRFFFHTCVVLQTTNRPQFAHSGVFWTRRCGCLCAKGDSISTCVYKYTRWRKKYQQARFFFHTCVVLKTTDRPQFARGGVCCAHDIVDIYAPKGILFTPLRIISLVDAKNINRLVFFLHTSVVLTTTDRPQFSRGGVLCTRHCGYLCAKGDPIYTFAYKYTRWRK